MVSTLAASRRTAIAVARALADTGTGVPLLVLDEPDGIAARSRGRRLFSALRLVAASGTSILFISHHLDEVLGLCDTVTVLRDGRLIATVHAGELSHDSLVELMLGRQLVRRPPPTNGLVPTPCPRLVTRGLFGSTVRDLHLEVGAGEVLGVAGLTGSGRESPGSPAGSLAAAPSRSTARSSTRRRACGDRPWVVLRPGRTGHAGGAPGACVREHDDRQAVDVLERRSAQRQGGRRDREWITG